MAFPPCTWSRRRLSITKSLEEQVGVPHTSKCWVGVQSYKWNGLFRHFLCLKSSAGSPLDVEKGLRNFSKFGENGGKSDIFYDNIFKHAHLRPGILQNFESLRSSVWQWLALEKGPRSIAPQGAKLWLFKVKEGNPLRNFSKFGENCLPVFKHLVLRPGVEF